MSVRVVASDITPERIRSRRAAPRECIKISRPNASNRIALCAPRAHQVAVLERRVGSGEYNPARTRVLHMRINPEAEARAAARLFDPPRPIVRRSHMNSLMYGYRAIHCTGYRTAYCTAHG